MEPRLAALNRYTAMKFGTRWPPVPAGILIGISMLLAFVVAGRGIGASGAMTRLVAWVQHGLFPAATEQSAYFGKYFAAGAHPLDDYVVFLVVGLIIGETCRESGVHGSETLLQGLL